MSSLQRYRKTGGFVQLLSLLETFGTAKRAKFLEMIEEESRPWAEALRDKMLTSDRVGEWPEDVQLKILKALPLKTQAYALAGFSKEIKDQLWRGFSPSEQRRLTDVYGENHPKAEEIASSVAKFVETARRMLVERELSAERIDPNLLIAGDVEAKLDGDGSSAALAPSEAGDAATRALKDARRENQVLKDEVVKLREKLDQIRRFAA